MKFLFVTALFFSAAVAFSQEAPVIKFGKISEADLNKKSYAIDTGANAVILADIGSTQVKGNEDGWFSLEFRHHRRVHILKNSGYNMATVEITLYKDGDWEEKLDDLKAVTYNLENGKVVETKLNVKTSVFKENIDKNTVVKKFTLPNVREGSVIEYEYKLTSEFLPNIQPWIFQGDVPRLWSQYTVSLPQFLDYTLIPQGNHPFYMDDQKSRDGHYFVEVKKDIYMGKVSTDRIDISCVITDFRWAMKDVPAFKEEAFTSSPNNYVAKLEFQLAGYLAPLTEEKIMTTWPDFTKRLLKREDFGEALSNNDNWLSSIMKQIVKETSNETEVARKIFTYVRDNFTCTDYNQIFIREPLKKIAENKNGGVAEINLLLTAMLRYAGLQADPVMLSTSEHGLIRDDYPLLSKFNYVISKVKADGKELLLDAGRPRLGFGKLYYTCYNGQARVINAEASSLALKTDQLTENNQASIFIYKEPGGKWTGYATKLYGYYASGKIRQKMIADGTEGLLKELSTGYGDGFKIDSVSVDSLMQNDEPVTLHYTIKYDSETADIIYMNPVFGERYKQNPFKSADRQYPVEMPYRQNDLYTLSMEIPDGYVVDELPKSVTLKLNTNNDAVFEYRITQSGETISLNYKLDINRTIFSPAEYNLLREFFGNMVAKLDEQIVFKKKK